MKNHWSVLLAILLVFGGMGCSSHKPGDQIDEWNGVAVFYNGSVTGLHGRNTTEDGYNIGLRWQCVEFVKRYYLEHLDHKMPDPYGNARDFYDPSVADGELNAARGLLQFTNGSISKPQPDDILVYKPTWMNKYGHISIVTEVSENSVSIIQQNNGSRTRDTFPLLQEEGKWVIGNDRILGWLRKE